ncbi:MAG: hypothetical protein QF535_01945, partial [Anaerolineales bacterium]|nr:hypothetical protein [Anaerolineales bacterium]
DVSCPKFSDFSKPETQINNVFTTIDGTCEEDSKWPVKDTHYTECPLNLPDGFEYYTGLWKYERADGKCGKDVDEKWEVRMINTLVAGAFGENSYVLGAAPKNCVVSITKTFEVDKPGGKVLSWWLRSGHANVKHNLDMYVNDELFKSVPGSSSRLYWHPFRETFADDVTSPVKLKFVTSAGLANVATGYIDEIEIGTESIQEAADETECAGDWEEDNPCAYTYDGKWSTRGLALKEAGVRHTATVTETYKKPEGATRASVWRVKAGSEYEVDLVLTPACFNNHDTIKVKAELISDDNFAKVYFYCWGSNEWVKIGTRNNYRGFTEDKMNWFIAD